MNRHILLEDEPINANKSFSSNIPTESKIENPKGRGRGRGRSKSKPSETSSTVGLKTQKESVNLISDQCKNTIHKHVIPAGTDIGRHAETEQKFHSKNLKVDTESGFSVPEGLMNFLSNKKKNKTKHKKSTDVLKKTEDNITDSENMENINVDVSPSRILEFLHNRTNNLDGNIDLAKSQPKTKDMTKEKNLSSTESDSSLHLIKSNTLVKSNYTHQFLIVHQDAASRKCKPIEKLLDLPDMHSEYFRHLSYDKKFGAPKHEMQKCKHSET